MKASGCISECEIVQCGLNVHMFLVYKYIPRYGTLQPYIYTSIPTRSVSSAQYGSKWAQVIRFQSLRKYYYLCCNKYDRAKVKASNIRNKSTFPTKAKWPPPCSLHKNLIRRYFKVHSLSSSVDTLSIEHAVIVSICSCFT